MHRAPTRAAIFMLAVAATRAARNTPGRKPSSIGRRSYRIAARWSRIVAGPNPSIIVRATTSRRSTSWKRDVGDSADTLALESEQLLPPAAEQVFQPFPGCRGNRRYRKGARRFDRRRWVVAHQVHLREDDAIRFLRQVDGI